MLNIRIIFALSILLMTFLCMNIAKANELNLVTIGNDENNKTYSLSVELSEDKRMIKTFHKDVYSDGKKISREDLDYRALINSGMILEQRKKHVVLKLNSSNFDNQQGGIITIDTLFNGAKNIRKNYEVQIAKFRSGWAIISGGRIIKQIFIRVNKVFLLGTVGIKNLEMR